MIDWLNDNTGAVQAISVAVLAVVTAVYAWRTWSISTATERQAHASVKMAEEMREARYSGAKPVIDFRPRDFSAGAWLRIAVGGHPPANVDCRLRNVGSGPALNVTFKVSLGDGSEGTRRIGVLGVSDEMPYPENVLLESPNGGEAVARVTYEDVFGRRWESRLSIPIAEEVVQPWRVDIVEAPGDVT